MGIMRLSKLFVLLAVLSHKYVVATDVDPAVLDACPGYSATNVKTDRTSLTADLTLAGEGCNVFGDDIPKLSLKVVYETRKFHPSMIFEFVADIGILR